ncbi:hypothetical protein CAMSH0001_0680 [Campylobacter showae RM3277]|uniref:Uncharacterized protein n=1 Tax=Campylobacter showae RM3277 TaxID=553219 RepID=C6RGM5_9BACT|nr:hypothetical protein CAMSH0001_0680 [Campylobacter showae RM3277]
MKFSVQKRGRNMRKKSKIEVYFRNIQVRILPLLPSLETYVFI